MRFRFCGDADCPDWLLMQINTISNLNIESLQELCQQVIQKLLGEEFNYNKVKELTDEMQLDLNDTKACVSAITLILRNSACHSVSGAELSTELEQLGLHRSHASSLTKVYTQHIERLTSVLRSQSLRVARPLNTNVSKIDKNTYKVQIQAWHTETQKEETHSFTMNHSQMLLLLSELKTIKGRMEELVPE